MSDREFTAVAGINTPLPKRQRPLRTSADAEPATGLINGFFEWFGSLGIFAWQVLRAAVTPPFEWRELDSSNGRYRIEISAPGCVGRRGHRRCALDGSPLQHGSIRGQVAASFGDRVYSVIQEMGPIITGLVVSGRVGAGIGAELASMKVTEQIDAIEASAINPYRLLAATRILACILMLPLLTLAADACGVFMGWLAQTLVEPVSFHQFIDSGFRGATLKRLSAANVQDGCVRPDYWAHRLLSGNAHTRRRRGCGPRSDQLSSSRLALRDPGRCCAG